MRLRESSPLRVMSVGPLVCVWRGGVSIERKSSKVCYKTVYFVPANKTPSLSKSLQYKILTTSLTSQTNIGVEVWTSETRYVLYIP